MIIDRLKKNLDIKILSLVLAILLWIVRRKLNG